MNLPKDKQSYVLWFDHITKDHASLVGDKAARLAKLVEFGISVPSGFAVNSHAFQDTFSDARTKDKVEKILKSTNSHDPLSIQQSSEDIGKIISRMKIQKDLSLEIFSNYEKLGKDAVVALRVSAKDQGSIVFQQEPILGIKGDANVVDCVRKSWARYFNQHTISALLDGMLELSGVSISVVIEKMIDSDVSGVTYTSSPASQAGNHMYIHAIWGLQDEYASKQPYPDLYEVNCDLWKVSSKEVVDQRIMFRRTDGEIEQADVLDEKQSIQKITDANIIKIAKVSKRIEDKLSYPQKVEWVIKDGELYILDSSLLNPNQKITHPKKLFQNSSFSNLKTIGTGEKIHGGSSTGPCRWIRSSNEIAKIRHQDIVIVQASIIRSLPFSKLAGIIVTDGSSHEKNILFLKEYGIPSILLSNFSHSPKNRQVISLKAEDGSIYQGALPARKVKSPPKKSKSQPNIKTATKIFINNSSTSSIAAIDEEIIEGVGIARSEFILSKDDLIDQRKSLNKLVTHMNLLCQKMKGKTVLYRLSDSAPDGNSLGLRGVRKHIVNKSLLALEAKAFHRAKHNHQHANLHLLLPFVRSTKDVREIKQVLAELQINRNKNTQFWIMAETPGSILDLPEIIKLGIDGVVVGLTDLTMLTLGIDRKEADLMDIYSKKQNSVQLLIKKAISIGKMNNLPIIISGGKLEIHPDIIEESIKNGVYGFSVEPSAVSTVTNYIHLAERRMIGLSL